MSVPPTTVGNGVTMVMGLSGTCRAASKAEKLNRRTLGNDANQAPDLPTLSNKSRNGNDKEIRTPVMEGKYRLGNL